MSLTRRTHWRNSARTSATRTSCAQHKCRPQGGGQSRTALVADLIISEVQVRQRGICLVKIARTCHAAAWSTHLTDVDDHVSATTLDAKLTELLHFMPCSAGRELCGQRKRTFKSCPLVSRHGISVHIVSFTNLWNLFTTSTHHQRPLGRASLPQDATPNTSNPHSCHAVSLRNMVFDNTTLFTLSSRGVPHLIDVVGS